MLEREAREKAMQAFDDACRMTVGDMLDVHDLCSTMTQIAQDRGMGIHGNTDPYADRFNLMVWAKAVYTMGQLHVLD